ncbi:DUF2934 domain-containing protein [Methylobacterium sp. GC_Met_2]|uniref:DUF2934 domain-containing protein n=1 Tax=Methylobacterium sp. GC_Met_2 TaxID=2937376 RepID=UPI00226BA41C
MSEDRSVDRAAEPVIADDEIRARAHDIWDRHHRPVGYDLQFWLMAERELKAERSQAVKRDNLRCLAS